MAISSDYAVPVIVNGYSCRNCTDVGYAKKHVDPEHPRSGPYGVNAKNDPTVHRPEAVSFGGTLGGPGAVTQAAQETVRQTLGAQLDLSA